MEGGRRWGRVGMTFEINWSDLNESLGKGCFLSLDHFKKEKMTDTFAAQWN